MQAHYFGKPQKIHFQAHSCELRGSDCLETSVPCHLGLSNGFLLNGSWFCSEREGGEREKETDKEREEESMRKTGVTALYVT